MIMPPKFQLIQNLEELLLNQMDRQIDDADHPVHPRIHSGKCDNAQEHTSSLNTHPKCLGDSANQRMIGCIKISLV